MGMACVHLEQGEYPPDSLLRFPGCELRFGLRLGGRHPEHDELWKKFGLRVIVELVDLVAEERKDCKDFLEELFFRVDELQGGDALHRVRMHRDGLVARQEPGLDW